METVRWKLAVAFNPPHNPSATKASIPFQGIVYFEEQKEHEPADLAIEYMTGDPPYQVIVSIELLDSQSHYSQGEANFGRVPGGPLKFEVHGVTSAGRPSTNPVPFTHMAAKPGPHRLRVQCWLFPYGSGLIYEGFVPIEILPA